MDFVKLDSALLQLGLHEGDTVADIGTGIGHALITLSRAVGETGKVLALDVQKDLLKNVTDLIEREKLENIETVWADVELPHGTTLPEKSLDAVVLSNVTFQLDEKKEALQEIKRILKPKGKLLLIDWADSFTGLGPSKDRVITEGEAEKLFMGNGFHKEKSFRAGPHHYGIVFSII